MKTPIIYLYLFLFSVVVVCAAGQSPVTVVDTDGNPVKRGVKYYVVPVQNTQGGGLDIVNTGSCPKSVVQVGTKVAGSSVVFYPLSSKDDIVRNGTDVNIDFSGAKTTGCTQTSTVWQITHDPDDTDTTHYVVSGGQKGNPSYSTARNWFLVLKTKNGYKFKFCPVTVCDCNPVCQDIGISVEGGNRLLKVDLSLPTFEFNFKKA